MRFKLICTAMLFLFCCLFCSCGIEERNNVSTQKTLNLIDTMTEVASNIYDNNISTAYIKVDKYLENSNDESIAEIVSKKTAWENMFPTKEIISISTMTEDSGMTYGYTAILGLLIHYKNNKK
jgi:hypothetical protein